MNRISLLTSALLFSVGFVACTDYQADYASAWENYSDYVAAGDNASTAAKDPSSSTATQPSTPSTSENTQPSTPSTNGTSGAVTCNDISGITYAVGMTESKFGCTCTSMGSWSCPPSSDIIDDFEDGNDICNAGGTWSAYSDGQDGGSTTFSNKISGGKFVVLFPGSTLNGTSYVAGLSNIKLNAGAYEYDPYAGLVVTLKADESAYDLSSCSTIFYDYSGAGHNFRVVMEGDLTGGLTKYDYHGYNVAASAGWNSVVIPMSSLKQKGWGSKVTLFPALIARFGWEIQKTAKYNYLYIDNVRCVGANIRK